VLVPGLYQQKLECCRSNLGNAFGAKREIFLGGDIALKILTGVFAAKGLKASRSSPIANSRFLG
jgi:hypothetical protein